MAIVRREEVIDSWSVLIGGVVREGERRFSESSNRQK
jgi:hypothetical protein